jgi:hypothetical protein
MIYWLGCGLAILLGLYALLGFFFGHPPYQWAAVVWILALAGGFWLVGRAARYILKGD